MDHISQKDSQLSGLRRLSANHEVDGSNPTGSFCLFFIFSKTLRACPGHIGTFRNMGPIPLKSRGSGVLLHAVKVRCQFSLETNNF